tara:strand:+ start:92209 stop:92649 length:441 start_codon:yes stop_codon:yes gene_type:complete
MEENHIHIYLKLYDFDLQPDEVTKMIGLEPTKSGVKRGNFYFAKKYKIEREYQSNWWEYKEKHITETKWQQEYVDDFINRIIKPRVEIIKSITTQGSGELALVPHYYDEWYLGFDFSLDIIKILSDSGIVLNMDIYCYDKEKNKEE